MKSALWCQRHGKVKDVAQVAKATVPAAQDVDRTVALIHALIPLGLKAAGEAPAGERSRRNVEDQDWRSAMARTSLLVVKAPSP